jgi:hypothetical protein
LIVFSIQYSEKNKEMLVARCLDSLDCREFRATTLRTLRKFKLELDIASRQKFKTEN